MRTITQKTATHDLVSLDLVAMVLIALSLVACDKDQKTPEPKDQDLAIPVSGKSFLVVEQTSDAEEAFPNYTTHEVVATDSGAKASQTFDGFHLVANGRNWTWGAEEKTVEGSRDCTCETFAGERCTGETTMMVAQLSQQGTDETWRPPIYADATDGLASWHTSRVRAWARGDLLFTSVCLEVMKCGETPRPVCQSTVWSLAGAEPEVVEIDTLTSKPKSDLLQDALGVAEPRSKAHQALTQAVESGSSPVLVELQPTFEGRVEQRWIVPADIRSTGDWTAYTYSVMHLGDPAGSLEEYAPQPRAVSIFSSGRDADFVGWTVEAEAQ